MWLNYAGGWSYNDLSQYHVFPWILDESSLKYESHTNISSEAIPLNDSHIPSEELKVPIEFEDEKEEEYKHMIGEYDMMSTITSKKDMN